MPAAATPLLKLLPYQRAWVEDDARFKIGMWARQTGKTFASCAEIIRDCVQAEIAGRRARWVILSRGARQAREAMEEVIKPLARGFSSLHRTLTWRDADPDFDADPTIQGAFEIVFAGGSRISALPANPDTARGFSANVLLDEFAFHRDAEAIWRALFPVISKPGLKLRVVSTPNGTGNKFHALMNDESNIAWSRYRVDIHQAIAQGLDRDAETLRRAAGDPDLWRQEFLLDWLDESSVWLSSEIIDACEDDAAGDPAQSAGGETWMGVDIARRRDLFVAVVLEKVGDVLWLREIVALRRAPFADQDAAMDAMIARYRPVRVAMDRTGIGERSVEEAQRRHGARRIEGVTFTSARRQAMADALKRAMEARTLRLPPSPELRADLRAIRQTFAATGAVRLSDDGSSDGHADRFWALAMAVAAASAPAPAYGYRALAREDTISSNKEGTW